VGEKDSLSHAHARATPKHALRRVEVGTVFSGDFSGELDLPEELEELIEEESIEEVRSTRLR
jgi:hypothetical protein